MRGLDSGRAALDRTFDFRNFWTWLLLGALVGVIAGLGAILFQMALEVTRLFCFQSLVGIDPGHPGGEAPLFSFPIAEAFSPMWLLVLPAIGGLGAGFLTLRFAPEARGHGTDAAIKAYHRQAGVIRWPVPVVKFFATVLSMGTGGSGGREGPIAQIGAGAGSLLATRLGLSARYRRWLLAAGLGAGVGAIFRAPLAGALFAGEVLYSDPEVETEVIRPAAVASIVAYAVFAAKYGYGHMFTDVTGTGFSNPLELGPYVVLAVVVAAGAALYIRVFYGMDGFFRRLRVSDWIKPVVGGFATGAVGLVLHLLVSDHRVLDVMSTGYGVLQDVVDGGPPVGIGVLLLVAVGKILTTSLTIGSGGSAGVFGPSMVIGGTLGAAVGQVLHSWMPGIVQHPANYAIVGMAGFFAAAANTPLSTIIMVSEMTGNYELLVPAVWVCALAFLVGRRWSIYRSQVPSKVFSPAHFAEYAMEIMGRVRVSEVYKKTRRFACVTPDMTLGDAMRATAETRQRVFPVLGADGRLAGAFHLAELMHALHSEPSASQDRRVRDLMHSAEVRVRMSDPVAQAHRLMTSRAVDELIVTDDRDPGVVVGILAGSDVLLAYNRRLALVESEAGLPVPPEGTDGALFEAGPEPDAGTEDDGRPGPRG